VPHELRGITLDLDDTLWPYGPVAAGIASSLGEFLASTAPRAAASYDEHALFQALTAPRESRASSPTYAAWMREEGLRLSLGAAGEDPDLAAQAIQITSEARQRVQMYPDVNPAVSRLGARFKLVALTNGTADVGRIGIADWFDAVVTGTDVGVGKPDPRIFHEACAVLGLSTREVMHVGDDLHIDVAGALDAGLQAAWVHRDDETPAPTGVLSVRDLLALADALGA